MSMELFVILAASHAPDTASWNRALADANVPAAITDGIDLTKGHGFLPVTVAGKSAGFRRFDVDSVSELAAHYPAIAKLNVEPSVVYTLGYGDPNECAAVFYSASVLVQRFGGVAFEPQGSVVMSAQELLDAAKECQAMANEDAQ